MKLLFVLFLLYMSSNCAVAEPTDLIECKIEGDSFSITKSGLKKYKIMYKNKEGICDYEPSEQVFVLQCEIRDSAGGNTSIRLQERQSAVGVWEKTITGQKRSRAWKITTLWAGEHKGIQLSGKDRFCSGKLRGDKEFVLANHDHDCGRKMDSNRSQATFGGNLYSLETGEKIKNFDPVKCVKQYEEKDLKELRALKGNTYTPRAKKRPTTEVE